MYGVPNRIITDNGTQFIGRKFLDFCDTGRIRVDWASVYHPKSNGQVERTNMVLKGIKTCIYNKVKIMTDDGWTSSPPCFGASGQA